MRNLVLTILLILSLSVCIFGQENSEVQDNIEKPVTETPAKDSSEAKSDENKTPLKILFKPQPRYPQSETGTMCFQGTITLRVEFLKTGKIGKVKPVNKLPYGATDNAIEAAKKIIFEPATVDGKPITVNKRVSFSFTIY